VQQQCLAAQIAVDSAGTSDWHVGEAPDQRSIAAGQRRGYDLSVLRARQVQASDFHRFDYILAMDAQNLLALQRLSPPAPRAKLALLLDYSQRSSELREVPDPYSHNSAAFEQVLDLCEDACAGLLQHLQQLQPLSSPVSTSND
jgi:protein-tyrosine phosphatase